MHKLTQKADRVQLSQADHCRAFLLQARRNEQGSTASLHSLGLVRRSREGVAGGQGGRGPLTKRLRGVDVGVLPKPRGKGQQGGRVEEHEGVLVWEFDQIEGELVSAVSSAAEPDKVISSLHQGCVWLLQNFDTQKTARAEEVAALNNASELILALCHLGEFQDNLLVGWFWWALAMVAIG